MSEAHTFVIHHIRFYLTADAHELLAPTIERLQEVTEPQQRVKLERRLAELLLNKLTSFTGQLTFTQVNEVLNNLEWQKEYATGLSEPQIPSTDQDAYLFEEEQTLKLHRDVHLGVAGGVLAGISHYTNIDVVWLRALTLMLIFGIFDVFFAGGLTLFAYLIVWWILPPKTDFKPEQHRMYRLPHSGKLAGVASGLAYYLRADVTIVRLALVALVFVGGAGLIIYLSGWFIVPVRPKHLPEVKGAPPVQFEIDRIKRISKELLSNSELTENIWHKAAEFSQKIHLPEKLAGAGLVKELYRSALILVGGLLFLKAISAAGFFTYGYALLLQLVTPEASYLPEFLFQVLNDSFFFDHVLAVIGYTGLFSLYLVILMPLLLVLQLSVSLMLQRHVGGGFSTGVLIAVWLLSISLTSWRLADEFAATKQNASFTPSAKTFAPTSEPLQISTPAGQTGSWLNNINVVVTGHADTTIQLLETRHGYGFNRQKAKKAASLVQYTIQKKGNHISLPLYYDLPDGEPYRMQSVTIYLKVPYNQVFQVDADIAKLLDLPTHTPDGEAIVAYNELWQMQLNEAKCVSCNTNPFGSTAGVSNMPVLQEQLFDIAEVGALHIAGEAKLVVERGEKNELSLQSLADEIQANYTENADGTQTLSIVLPERKSTEPIAHLRVSSTLLRQLNLEGNIDVNMRYASSKSFTLTHTGMLTGKMDITTPKLELQLSGAGKVLLEGDAEVTEVVLQGLVDLQGSTFRTTNANLQVLGQCKLNMWVRERAEVETAYPETVSILGDAKKVFSLPNF